MTRLLQLAASGSGLGLLMMMRPLFSRAAEPPEARRQARTRAIEPWGEPWRENQAALDRVEL